MYRYIFIALFICSARAALVEMPTWLNTQGPRLVFEKTEGSSGIDVYLKWQQKIEYLHDCSTMDEYSSTVSLRAYEACKEVGPLANLESVKITSRNRLWASIALALGGGVYDITEDIKNHCNQRMHVRKNANDEQHLVVRVAHHYKGWSVLFRWDALIPRLDQFTVDTVLYEGLFRFLPDDLHPQISKFLEQKQYSQILNEREDKGLSVDQVGAILASLVLADKFKIAAAWFAKESMLVIKGNVFDESETHASNLYYIPGRISQFQDIAPVLKLLSYDYNKILPYMMQFKLCESRHKLFFSDSVSESAAAKFAFSIMQVIGK